MNLSRSDYQAEVRHDGRLHSFVVRNLEAPTCQACGERLFTESVDEQINAALREHLHLLSPAQIREAIKRVQLSQKDVSQQLGIAEATLSRWLSKTQIQSRSMDTLLRVFLAFPSVRQVLATPSQLAQFGLTDFTADDAGQIAHRPNVTNGNKHRRVARSTGKEWNGTKEKCAPAQDFVRGSQSTWGKSK